MIITTQPAKGGKIKLFADGEYVQTLDGAFWYSQGLYDGDALDEEKLRALLLDASCRRALHAAMGMLSHRAHSRAELYNKLIQKGYPEEACAYALERAAELSLQDDADYAAQLASSLYERKGYSPERIRVELLQKGVDREIIENTLEGLDSDPAARIIELLDTKYSSYPRDEKGKRRIFSALLRLGYNINDIRKALRESGLNGDDIE